MHLLQVTLELRDRLHTIGVEVNVKTFEEIQGIAGLGEDPFVSLQFLPRMLSIHSHSKSWCCILAHVMLGVYCLIKLIALNLYIVQLLLHFWCQALNRLN